MASISGSSSAAGSEPRPWARGVRAMGLTAALAVLGTIGALTTDGPRFYPDDPLSIDDDAALDASAVVAVEDANSYDFVVNTFTTPGDRRDVRALNVNTLDEVPDSSWFVNRMGREAMAIADVVRGPDRVESISLDGWIVSGRQSHRRAAGISHDQS